MIWFANVAFLHVILYQLFKNLKKPSPDFWIIVLHYQITDACSACFEQRTVFTQQVLAKALNQMVRRFHIFDKYMYVLLSFVPYCGNFQVDQTPLPLLFMRTVIQAIDAFPALVNFLFYFQHSCIATFVNSFLEVLRYCVKFNSL